MYLEMKRGVRAMSSITRRQFLVDGSKVVASTSILASLLAACGGSGGGSNPGTLTLRYWNLGYQPHGANQTGVLTDKAVNAYLKSHPNTKSTITGYTGDQAGFTKVTQAVRGGASVDLFRLPADELPVLVAQNLIAPIDDYLTSDDKADIFPYLLDAVKYNGKTYAWPLWVPPVGMYLNTDIFKERGVDLPSENWTYEEFVSIAQRLTFTRGNGQKVYGYTALIDPGVVNAWPIIMGDGGVPLSSDNKQYTFNSPEGVSGLQKLVDLAHKYKVTPPDFGTQALDAIVTGFSQNKNYAMYSEPSGSSSNYKAMGMNFTIRPMPIGKLGKPLTTGGIGLIVVSQTNNTDSLKASMDMAKYLTGSQVAKDVPDYYLAPGARKSVTTQDPINLFTPFVSYTYLPPIITPWAQIRTLLHTQLQNAILGKTTPEKALNDPASEINSILAGNQ
jgi:multiple sugar transport system substrate-binding protein